MTYVSMLHLARSTVRDILWTSVSYVERYNVYAAMDAATQLITYLPVHKKKMLRISSVHVLVTMQELTRQYAFMHLWYLCTYYGASFRCFGHMFGHRPEIWHLIRMSVLNISFKIAFFTKNIVIKYNRQIFAHQMVTTLFGHSFFFAEYDSGATKTYVEYFAAIKRLQEVCALYTNITVAGYFLNNVIYPVTSVIIYEQRLCVYRTSEVLYFFKKIPLYLVSYIYIHYCYLVHRYLLVCAYQVVYFNMCVLGI